MSALENIDYYHALRVPEDATPEEVKKGFYRSVGACFCGLQSGGCVGLCQWSISRCAIIAIPKCLWYVFFWVMNVRTPGGEFWYFSTRCPLSPVFCLWVVCESYSCTLHTRNYCTSSPCPVSRQGPSCFKVSSWPEQRCRHKQVGSYCLVVILRPPLILVCAFVVGIPKQFSRNSFMFCLILLRVLIFSYTITSDKSERPTDGMIRLA